MPGSFFRLFALSDPAAQLRRSERSSRTDEATELGITMTKNALFASTLAAMIVLLFPAAANADDSTAPTTAPVVVEDSNNSTAWD